MACENLDEFRCCLSEEKHFIIQPITLTKCGHSACKECFPNVNKNKLNAKDAMSFLNLILKHLKYQ
jgi:hypothetical protein